jgi:hypothetical protein
MFGSLIFVVMVSVGVLAHAGGDELGNGGDVLVHVENGRAVYEVLDLYEGRMLRGFEPRKSLMKPNGNLEELMALLEAKDPSRACLYKTWLKDFKNERELDRTSLTNIHDEGPVYIPDGYKLVQTVIQDSDAFKRGNPRYYIDKKIFNRMDEFNRAAMVVHELIYREGLTMNRPSFKNSVRVRYFDAFLFSKQVLKVSRATYEQVCEASGLPTTENYCDLSHPIYKK